eukprot:s1358_g11.t1
MRVRALCKRCRRYLNTTPVVRSLGTLTSVQTGAAPRRDAQQQRLKKRTLQIGDFGKQQQWEMALGVMRRMRQELLQPSIFTFSALATACSRGNQWEPPLQLLSEMQRELVHPDAHFFSTLISACAIGQEWERSLKLFEELQEYRLQPNLVTYNATMNACSKGWQWQGVLSLFSDLVVSNTRPDGMSFATCITANGNASFWERSLELFNEMQRKMRADVVSFSSIINACGVGSAWQMSLKFLAHLRVYDLRPNVATYGAAIAAVERGSQWAQALALLKQMERDQCHPNTISLGASLVALQRGLQWQHAMNLMHYYGLEDEASKDLESSPRAQKNCVPRDDESEEPSRDAMLGNDWNAKRMKAKLLNSTAAIKAHLDMSDWANALRLFSEMRDSAVPPDGIAYSLAIRASGLGAQCDRLLAFSHEILRQKIPIDMASLVQAISACKEQEQLFAITRQIIRAQQKDGRLVSGCEASEERRRKRSWMRVSDPSSISISVLQ